ncbi:hypothetical protein Acid345_3151 [Candidatus Koribacter versatilis Ellin345]|uniref:Uncharacterized protein n=1 Tax=Koribacter versatilis (strain Ellin345) TaxID=204669 RepID=Q1ILU8_KORVE|nr:hypothetical protein [Candidatus Koribacter versatilis]ABF42152.1 hypothetical protein Acid345_3151 [Candidatus Koribacter versatilis Ellin345]
MRTKLEIAGSVVLLVLLLLVGWEEHRKAMQIAVAETKAQADQDAEKKIASALKQLDDQKQALDRQQQAQTAALAKMTVPQITVKLPDVVPQASAPVKVLDVNSAAVKNGEAKVGDVIVPQEDVRPVAEKLLEGQQCTAQLGICSQKTDLMADQLKAKSDEAAQWKQAAKGGSVLKRVGKVALAVGIGAAIGYGAAHH